MAFCINIHRCQLHPKKAIYVVNQLKNDSFRQGLYVPLPTIIFPSFSTKLSETCLAGCPIWFKIKPLQAKSSFWVRSIELLNSVTLNSKQTITILSSNTNWASANAQMTVETRKVQRYFIFQPFSSSIRQDGLLSAVTRCELTRI